MRVIISYVMGKFDIAPFNYPVEYKNKFKKREMITWRLSEFSKNLSLFLNSVKDAIYIASFQ